MRSSRAAGLVGLAATTTLLGASPAHADPRPHATPRPHAEHGRWINIGHDSHSPTISWRPRAVFKSRSRVLQLVYRCWDGGDRTRIQVVISRKFAAGYSKEKAHMGLLPCGRGTVRRLTYTGAKKGAHYQIGLFLRGHRHTIEYWVQNEL
ncbi:hypothetical protein J4573_34795 [Actinomadura barringtoniae]|uniref:Secreted protein n=1 Tax=Actinomadura barringtoniae TaxID=1427535 RepID=A0A939T6S5_9ACTN|nr:hypothetical protein [Actinomadura barringtoniae]MBO2452303.1 hypothetical protein [Actinomadura barringtoniae]